jgi:TRAP-type C4-dicarboxylate transport system permease small subunit
MRLLPPTLFLWLVLAGTAMAQNETEPAGDNGEGFAGETTDKVVTFFSLGVVIFFVLVVSIGTLIQMALERRKERRKAAHFQRAGW